VRRRRVLLLLAIPVLLATLEGAARVLASRDSRFNVFIGGSREFDPVRGQRLKRSYVAGEIHTSSLGTLGRDFEPGRPASVYRIVVLGDSCSFMPPARPYPLVLEELLRRRLGRPSVEVVNASCPGYDSFQARAWYEDEIDAWDHDALIIYVGWNDLAQYNPDGLAYKLEERGYLPEPTPIQRALIGSYLLRSLYVVGGYLERRGAVSHEPLSAEEERRYAAFRPERYEENLNAIVARARRRGRPVFLLGLAGLIREGATAEEEARMDFPRGMGKSVAKLVAVKSAYRAAQARVPGATLVDLEPLFATEEERRSFTDRVHWDARGAERVAARLLDAVAPVVTAPGEGSHQPGPRPR
jgi:lysophospholipase L1-like esterase